MNINIFREKEGEDYEVNENVDGKPFMSRRRRERWREKIAEPGAGVRKSLHA